MDFLKKLFGSDKKEDQEPAEQGSDVSTRGDAQGSSPVGLSTEQQDHDQGHPTGKSGKNVCEFC